MSSDDGQRKPQRRRSSSVTENSSDMQHIARRPSIGRSAPSVASSLGIQTPVALSKPPPAHLASLKRTLSLPGFRGLSKQPDNVSILDAESDTASSSSLLDMFAGKGASHTFAQEEQQQADFWNMLSLPTTSNLLTLPSTTNMSWSNWFNPNPTPDATAKGKSGTKSDEQMLEEDDKAAADDPPWAKVKDRYEKPKFPLVFVHGLLGFDTFGPKGLLQISYWRGVREAFEASGVEVLITRVPASASIKERAEVLHDTLKEKMAGREINIIGHSQGGLDARCLAAHMKPSEYTIKTITTIASPHRGSAVADYVLDNLVGEANLPSFMSLWQAIPGQGKAFTELKRSSMRKFNEEMLDDPNIRYFSYGARCWPSLVDTFRVPWKILEEAEGDNDGLVSVESSKWGDYLGTIDNVNHLDLIGWISKFRFTYAELLGRPIPFKPVSFYMSVAERLAQDGF